jgi:hypothetical protein
VVNHRKSRHAARQAAPQNPLAAAPNPHHIRALEAILSRHPVFHYLPNLFELISLARAAGRSGLQLEP